MECNQIVFIVVVVIVIAIFISMWIVFSDKGTQSDETEVRKPLTYEQARDAILHEIERLDITEHDAWMMRLGGMMVSMERGETCQKFRKAQGEVWKLFHTYYQDCSADMSEETRRLFKENKWLRK